MKMYYTSNYGDVNIEQLENNVVIETTALTTTEESLLKEILKKYKGKIPEFTESDTSIENRKFTIENVKFADVHKTFTKILKKNKPTITALKFKDGRIEVTEELKDKDAEEATTGATVNKPRRHCPIPSFQTTEFRASNVLKEFLTEQQLQDFEQHRQFIVKGNYTGRKYLITSRWSQKIKTYGQIYDLSTNELICANCNELPPSEEMLSLKLILEYREREFMGNKF